MDHFAPSGELMCNAYYNASATCCSTNFHGLKCRRTMGADIAGACGQLVVEQEKKMQAIGDIEDGPLCSSSGKKSKVMNSNERKRSNDSKEGGSDPASEKLVRNLTIATGIATSCFVLSAILFAIQRRKR